MDKNSYKNSLSDYKKIIYNEDKKIKKLETNEKKLNDELVRLKQIVSEQEKLINIYRNPISRIKRKASTLNKMIHQNKNNQKEKKEKNTVNVVIDEKSNKENIKMIPYDSHYEENVDFSNRTTDIKPLAFYLPQYHTFKENDEWWGKGFTEWTNVKKAKPRFEGHYEPRIPHEDFGYYTLDNSEILKKQVKLAKQHGIYGFCFYYYWFSGKRLLEKPVDIYLKDKSIDFPFCFCWANENWTRSWDGLKKNILMEQKYSDDDPEKFIKDIKKYFDDKRYIRIDGKPLLLVYNPKEIPNYKNVVEKWRKTARDIGIGEIEIWSERDMAIDDISNIDFVDAEFDFAPHAFSSERMKINKYHNSNLYNCLFDYKKMVKDITYNFYKEFYSIKPFVFSCTMGWDNSPRRKNEFFSYYEYNPKSFYEWLCEIIRETRRRNPEDKRFMLVNAWNEWGEGTYLEPDKKYGYTNINTLSKAIYDLPYDNNVIVSDNNFKINDLKNPKIAVQAHIYYIEYTDEILDELNKIPYKFDLYISTDTLDKKQNIINKIKKRKFENVREVQIKIIKNIGRDIYPFLTQMKNYIDKYDYVCHIHTKHKEFYDDLWRKDLYKNLFGSQKNIKNIFTIFKKNKNIGIICPEYFYMISDNIEIGSNLKNINEVLKIVKLDTFNIENEKLDFPAGSMFWARTNAIKPLFKNVDKFSFNTNSLVDGNIERAIERLFGIIPEKLGYQIIHMKNNTND